MSRRFNNVMAIAIMGLILMLAFTSWLLLEADYPARMFPAIIPNILETLFNLRNNSQKTSAQYH